MKKQRFLVLCLTVLLFMVLGGASVFAEGAPAKAPAKAEEITVDVGNVSYGFPRKADDKTAFEAVVNNVPKDSVVSYQWFLDGDKIPDATKATLELPVINIFGKLPSFGFKCDVTVDGKLYSSNEANLETPSSVGSGVLLGNVQVAPGETKPIGSGEASLSADGLTLTLNNVKVESPDATNDPLLAYNNGSFISFTEAADVKAKEDGSIIISGGPAETKATQIILKGKNEINNVVSFDEAEPEPVGTALNILTLGNTIISGDTLDDTLNVTGGKYGLATAGLDELPSTLHIKGATINATSTNDLEDPSDACSAISTFYGLKVTDNALVKATSSTVGNTITVGNDEHQYGNFEILNATVEAKNNYKYSGKNGEVGGDTVSTLLVDGVGMSMDNAAVFKGSIPNWNLQSPTYHRGVDILSIDPDATAPAFSLKGGSKFSFDIKALEDKTEALIAAVGLNIFSVSRVPALVDNATLSVNVDLGKRGTSLCGIATNAIDFKNASTCSVNTSTKGSKNATAYGLSAGTMNIDQSTADIKINYTEKEANEVAAIRTESESIALKESLSIKLDSPDQTVKAVAENGVAFASHYGITNEPTPFNPNYKPTQIKLGAKAAIQTPEKSQISSASVRATAENEYDSYETVYNQADTTAPASAVVIAGTGALEPASITKDLTDITVKVGEQAAFGIENTGSLPLVYKWEISTDGGKNWTMIQDAMGQGYTTSAATEKMNGYQYRCSVSNAAGTAVSKAATLTVTTTPAPTPTPTPKPGPNTGLGTTSQNTPITAALSLITIALLTLGCYQYSKRKMQ